MTWDRTRATDDNDPTINNRNWRKLREQTKGLGLPCARCGGWIDYDNVYGKQNRGRSCWDTRSPAGKPGHEVGRSLK